MADLEAIQEAVRRQSAMMLDNIGIKIDTSALPSAPLKIYVSRQMFGRGRLSSIWCYWVRPWLMPRRHAEIEAAYEVVIRQFQQEMLNVALEQGQAMIDG